MLWLVLLLIVIVIQQHLWALLRPWPGFFNLLQFIVDHVLVCQVFIFMAHIVSQQLQSIDHCLGIFCLLLRRDIGTVDQAQPWLGKALDLPGGYVETDVHIVLHFKRLTNLWNSLWVARLFGVSLSWIENFVDYIAHDWFGDLVCWCDELKMASLVKRRGWSIKVFI